MLSFTSRSLGRVGWLSACPRLQPGRHTHLGLLSENAWCVAHGSVPRPRLPGVPAFPQRTSPRSHAPTCPLPLDSLAQAGACPPAQSPNAARESARVPLFPQPWCPHSHESAGSFLLLEVSAAPLCPCLHVGRPWFSLPVWQCPCSDAHPSCPALPLAICSFTGAILCTSDLVLWPQITRSFLLIT